ncbi:MAG: hypothetical protein Q8Q09_25925 [Deltaproteobacteria bacterium]|nr:hypothetical protein [Deltaproteobacteria bacterium]
MASPRVTTKGSTAVWQVGTIQRSVQKSLNKTQACPRVSFRPKSSKSSILLKSLPTLTHIASVTVTVQRSKDPHERDNRIIEAGAVISFIEYVCIQDYGLPEDACARMIEAIRNLVRDEQRNDVFYSQLSGYQFQAEVANMLSVYLADIEHRYVDWQGGNRWADIVLTNGSYVECKGYAENSNPSEIEKGRFRAQARAYARSGVDVTYIFKNGVPGWCREILEEEFRDHEIDWDASLEDITRGGEIIDR